MPKAIYEGIYREIRSRIINGTYAFQEMLPTEAELTAEFGCTRNTVRRALSMLADEMFVQPIHGKGVRVIWLKGETDMLGALEEVESFGEFAKRNNAVASTDVKSFEHLICTEQLSRHLGFKVGEELIRVVRVRSLNGSARQVDHGYFSGVDRQRPDPRDRGKLYLRLSGAQARRQSDGESPYGERRACQR